MNWLFDGNRKGFITATCNPVIWIAEANSETDPKYIRFFALISDNAKKVDDPIVNRR